MRTENSPYSLSGKTIVVTGASSGIGKACAIAISRMGGRLILIARNEKRLKAVLKQLSGTGHTVFSQDLVQFDALADLIKTAAETGPIFGLIHAAGIEMTLPLRNMHYTDYEKLFALNVTAGFELARLVSKKKIRDPSGGSYIFISSTMGLVGQSGLVGYCGSKGALIAGSKAIAAELASYHIRVNCICPGHVQGTLMSDQLFSTLSEDAGKAIINAHPLGLGEPEDVAYACVFLLSDAARWMTGAVLPVDGGYTMV
ncbi:SDR family oxidoreductase [bacterium]|nr:SDR family oxidoreductase [bacterium]